MKLYVENLPADVTEQSLKDVFAQIGEVESVKIRAELLSMNANKYGIIDMTLELDAYRAISCFEGASFSNRNIHVREQYPLLEKAKTMFEQMTDGHSLPSFNPRAAFDQWKQQHWDH